MVEANEGGVGRSPTPTIAESVVVDCECDDWLRQQQYKKLSLAS
jgi:hypothetical protein